MAYLDLILSYIAISCYIRDYLPYIQILTIWLKE
jgi:hypothetical protein